MMVRSARSPPSIANLSDAFTSHRNMAARGGPPIAVSGGVIDDASGGGEGGSAALLERARQAEESGPCARDTLCADGAVASALLRFAKATSIPAATNKPLLSPCSASPRRSTLADSHRHPPTHSAHTHARFGASTICSASGHAIQENRARCRVRWRPAQSGCSTGTRRARPVCSNTFCLCYGATAFVLELRISAAVQPSRGPGHSGLSFANRAARKLT